MATEVEEATKEDGKQAKPPRTAKKKKSADLTDPTKIIESILAKSSFKVANLSQLVEKKFYHTPEFSTSLRKDLEDVRYESVVGNKFTYDDLTVMPEGFEGQVNVGPTAILNMTCINHVPDRRHRWKRRGKNKRSNNINNNNANNDDPKNQVNKEEEANKVRDEQMEVDSHVEVNSKTNVIRNLKKKSRTRKRSRKAENGSPATKMII